MAIFTVDNNLDRIMKENAPCDYGKRYEFDCIKTVEAYQKQLPLMDDAAYAPLVSVSTELGDGNILTSARLAGYLPLGGDGLIPAYRPVSKAMLGAYVPVFMDLIRQAEGSTFLFERETVRARRLRDGNRPYTVLSMLVRECGAKVKFNAHKAFSDKVVLTAPKALFESGGEEKKPMLACLFALADASVKQIIVRDAADIPALLELLEQRWALFCRAIECGAAPQEIERKGCRLRRSPARAAALRKVFEAGFDASILKRIWPKCSRVIVLGEAEGMACDEAAARLEGLALEQRIMSSEGLMSEGCVDADGQFALCDSGCFMEYLPLDALFDDEPVLHSELEADARYRMVVTNRSGMYRLKTGVVVTYLGENRFSLAR